MARYIPPNKRHSVESGRRTPPTPEAFALQFRRILDLSPNSSIARKTGKIIYANNSISRWFAVGLDDEHQFPPNIWLKPVFLESIQRREGETPLILVNDKHSSAESDGVVPRCLRTPWDVIAADVLEGLLSSFGILRSEMEAQRLEKIKPTLVARFGKIVFRESPSMRLVSICQRKRLVSIGSDQQLEDALMRSKRTFYTNLPSSYVDSVLDQAVNPEIGLEFEEQRDIYHVKLSDNRKPDATLSCKCTVREEDKKLQLHKVELNQVRQMVTDISCLDKNIDLRLMLCSKRILTSLTDDEMSSIQELIDCAVVEADVKGGLKWPLGKRMSSGDRYSVVGVWHTVHKAFSNTSLRLKVRDADRFDFMKGTGEASREVSKAKEVEASPNSPTMRPINLSTPNPTSSLISPLKHANPIPFPRLSILPSLSLTHPCRQSFNRPRFIALHASDPTKRSDTIDAVQFDHHNCSNAVLDSEDGPGTNLNVQVGNALVPSFIHPWMKLSLADQAFFLFTFAACTTCVAFTSLVVAAVPTLHATRRAALSLSKLADAAREELPSTMAAIRLSGMEISDLTLELSDLSHEISDGVNKSAQAVQAAEAGIRQIGTLAHQHTISMIEERANLPVISLQPVVVGAAKKTSHAVGQATKSFLNLISGGQRGNDRIDRVEM
ncbi:unnamed protein product [Linum tenue]|uniref:DUF7903 domain-containing protein n=1 Tax=Linum tenue TaxID=586396 RepID=A0AAV0LIG2_9ROSI|nr:unnamed protein product [Linum tenue]